MVRWEALAVLLIAMTATAALTQAAQVVVARLEGTVDEGMVYLARRAAAEARGKVLVIEIDSYGGYMQSADRIVAEILTCNCKVVAWIPPGAKAVSAAALVALAAEKLYVAPGAVLGAVKPYPQDEKVMEYVFSRLVSLLERRGTPNASALARAMVYEARSLSAEDALRLRVADGSASTLEEVLRAENLSGAPVSYIAPDPLRDVYSLVFNPIVAILFLLLGALLVALELHVAGFQGWGVAGAALILLAMYTFNLVGLGVVTLALAILGVALIAAELLHPGIQIFGVAGVSLLALALLLEYFSNPFALSASAAAVLAALAILAGLVAVVILKGAEVLRMPVPSLEEKLIGKRGVAKTAVTRQGGVVLVESELWSAVSDEDIPPGSAVEVVGVEGVTLRVRKVGEQ